MVVFFSTVIKLTLKYNGLNISLLFELLNLTFKSELKLPKPFFCLAVITFGLKKEKVVYLWKEQGACPIG
jgi:hypothetical protein